MSERAYAAVELAMVAGIRHSEAVAILAGMDNRRNPDEWIERIDRDALADAIGLAPDPSHAGMGTRHVGMNWAREMADAVLAALPELMGGGER